MADGGAFYAASSVAPEIPERLGGKRRVADRGSVCHVYETTQALDLRRHRAAAVTSLIPALSCRSCRPNAPFAELVKLSKTSIADEMREEHARRVLGD